MTWHGWFWTFLGLATTCFVYAERWATQWEGWGTFGLLFFGGAGFAFTHMVDSIDKKSRGSAS